MSKLAKIVALVTGGSRGIGAAIAKRLAADGASVAITYAKDASAASAVVKAIELGGGKAIAIQADAANVEAVILHRPQFLCSGSDRPPEHLEVQLRKFQRLPKGLQKLCTGSWPGPGTRRPRSGTSARPGMGLGIPTSTA